MLGFSTWEEVGEGVLEGEFTLHITHDTDSIMYSLDDNFSAFCGNLEGPETGFRITS